MRIERINLSWQVFETMGVGLPTLPTDQPLTMRDLGKCVVIAGQNGAGKTRLLTLLEQVTTKYLTPAEAQEHELEIGRLKARSAEIDREIRRYEEVPRNGDAPGQKQSLERELASIAQEVEHRSQALEASAVLAVQGANRPRIVPFVPRATVLEDPASLMEAQAVQRARAFESSLSSREAHTGAPAYARHKMRAAVAARGRKGLADQGASEPARAEGELLALFETLLGPGNRFELDESLNLRLEGLGDAYATLLSDGQKILFQLACLIHAQGASLKECIVVLDEPENHLHPSVINEFVDRLQHLLVDGQLWIATHSVPLIAHMVAMDPDCLWFARDGRFTPASRTPEKVLHALLGGPEGARRVNELTLLPSRFGSFLFLRQCLLPPGVIGYRQGDLQTRQIQEILKRLRKGDGPLTVVDYGAGKGRLLLALASGSEGHPIENAVDYLAFEPHAATRVACEKTTADLYGTSSPGGRTFADPREMLRERGEHFADVVVMCNVLHEADPSLWLQEFGDGSPLTKLLKEEGFLLIVEDYALPVGESAHDYGFLLLDEDQFKELFLIEAADVDEERFLRRGHSNPDYESRLVAHLVAASCLGRMTIGSQWRAIRSLYEQSLSRLKGLHARAKGDEKAGHSSQFGRETALVTQLVANSALWLTDHVEPD